MPPPASHASTAHEAHGCDPVGFRGMLHRRPAVARTSHLRARSEMGWPLASRTASGLPETLPVQHGAQGSVCSYAAKHYFGKNSVSLCCVSLMRLVAASGSWPRALARNPPKSTISYHWRLRLIQTLHYAAQGMSADC